MEGITLGQVGLAVTFLVGLVSGIAYLKKNLTDWMKNALKPQFDSVNKRLDEVDMESCKNFLVQFLTAVDKGEAVGALEIERFWEQYEHYTKIGGNSYIKRKVEQLVEDGKL